MKSRNRALTPIFAVLAGCAGDPAALAEKGYSLYGHHRLRFEVDRDVLREWGGSESPKFNQVLEAELERRRLCRDGYALRHEGADERIFRVTVRCRS